MLNKNYEKSNNGFYFNSSLSYILRYVLDDKLLKTRASKIAFHRKTIEFHKK